MAAQQAADKAKKFGVKEVEVKVKGPGSGAKARSRRWKQPAESQIHRRHHPTPHNGCRPRKKTPRVNLTPDTRHLTSRTWHDTLVQFAASAAAMA